MTDARVLVQRESCINIHFYLHLVHVLEHVRKVGCSDLAWLISMIPPAASLLLMCIFYFS